MNSSFYIITSLEKSEWRFLSPWDYLIETTVTNNNDSEKLTATEKLKWHLQFSDKVSKVKNKLKNQNMPKVMFDVAVVVSCIILLISSCRNELVIAILFNSWSEQFRPMFHIRINQIVGFYQQNARKTPVKEWHFASKNQLPKWNIDRKWVKWWNHHQIPWFWV